MNGHDYLAYLLIFLVAAVIAVPLFRRLGLGAVLGYLAAGVVLGPDVLGFAEDPETALAVSEFGVVLLLFIIGLELSPQRLWLMRRSVFLVGGLQVVLSTAAIATTLSLFGFGIRGAIVVGMGLALSSTAVGLQILTERKELATPHGRAGFAVLLFQDLIAIPLLAAIPLIGVFKAAGAEEAVIGTVLRGVGALVAVVLLGRYVLHYLFRAVARARAVEVFTAAALLVVAGTAWLMQLAGLSMGLGAFVAGVLLADSEFRHELESHIEPFKGLLLGLFFMAVGMTVDLDVVADQPGLIALGVFALIAAKGVVLFALGRTLAGGNTRDALLLASLLAMGGEFAFVVFAEASRAGLLAGDQRDVLVAIVGLSMAVTPLVLLAVQRFAPDSGRRKPPPETGELDAQVPRVIIAGFGRVGQIVARLLRAHNVPFTALENSPEQVEVSRRFGNKIYYGDPARAELLRAAHAERAEVFVLATDDPEANIRTARMVRRMYPHLKIYARVRNRQHAFRLMDLGVDGVVRETFHSSLVMGRHVLQALGIPAEVAAERVERFRGHDEQLLREQHLVYDDEAAVIASSQEAMRELERIFDADAFPYPGASGAEQRRDCTD